MSVSVLLTERGQGKTTQAMRRVKALLAEGHTVAVVTATAAMRRHWLRYLDAEGLSDRFRPSKGGRVLVVTAALADRSLRGLPLGTRLILEDIETWSDRDIETVRSLTPYYDLDLITGRSRP